MLKSNSEQITDWFKDTDVHVIDNGFRETAHYENKPIQIYVFEQKLKK